MFYATKSPKSRIQRPIHGPDMSHPASYDGPEPRNPEPWTLYATCGSVVLNIEALEFRHCFGFRYSNFGFLHFFVPWWLFRLCLVPSASCLVPSSLLCAFFSSSLISVYPCKLLSVQVDCCRNIGIVWKKYAF